MEILTTSDWTEYELIDTGNREKLERFGKYILIRLSIAPTASCTTKGNRLQIHHLRYLLGEDAPHSEAQANLLRYFPPPGEPAERPNTEVDRGVVRVGLSSKHEKKPDRFQTNIIIRSTYG